MARLPDGRVGVPAASDGGVAGGRWSAHVGVADETLAVALARHLRGAGCRTVVRGRREVVVVLDGRGSLHDALVELSSYLGRWDAADRAVRWVSVGARRLRLG